MILMFALCINGFATEAPYYAFLAKAGHWSSHPDVPSLKIGSGTVVILKYDGVALRYTGEVWEANPRKRYELQYHSGFIADAGRWTISKVKGIEVVFTTTSSEKTIPLPQIESAKILSASSCKGRGQISTAVNLVCGGMSLRRITLKSVPSAIDAAISRGQPGK